VAVHLSILLSIILTQTDFKTSEAFLRKQNVSSKTSEAHMPKQNVSHAKRIDTSKMFA
jgi:hypothetical protein